MDADYLLLELLAMEASPSEASPSHVMRQDLASLISFVLWES